MSAASKLTGAKGIDLAKYLKALEPASPGFGTVEALGEELFTRFFYPFEAISLLLLVAMIGAVLLAKRRL